MRSEHHLLQSWEEHLNQNVSVFSEKIRWFHLAATHGARASLSHVNSSAAYTSGRHIKVKLFHQPSSDKSKNSFSFRIFQFYPAFMCFRSVVPPSTPSIRGRVTRKHVWLHSNNGCLTMLWSTLHLLPHHFQSATGLTQNWRTDIWNNLLSWKRFFFNQLLSDGFCFVLRH